MGSQTFSEFFDHSMFPARKAAKAATSHIGSLLRKLPMSVSWEKVEFNQDVMDAKYHPIYLELKNEGIQLNKAFENPEEIQIKTEPGSAFARKYTKQHLDTRYSIFAYQNLSDSVTTYPCEPYLDPGLVCVVVISETDWFLGMVTYEIEDDIFRVFDLSKEFEFRLCCSHHCYLFPAGKAAPDFQGYSATCTSGLVEGDRIFYCQVARSRMDHKLHQATFIAELPDGKASIKLDGSDTIQTVSLQHVAKMIFAFSPESQERLSAFEKTFSYDPSDLLDEKREKKQKVAKVPKKAKLKKPEPEPEHGEVVEQIDTV